MGLPIVAADSQLARERAPEPQPHPKDERWLNKPFHLGLSAILGLPQSVNPFLMTGVEFGYALPYVSFAGTVGYLGGINASLAARGRLNFSRTVAFTLGVRGALVPLDDSCPFDFGQSHTPCEKAQHWDRVLLGGGEGGIEGRTEGGFMWRVQMGYWGLLAHGAGSCRLFGSGLSCPVTKLQPGLALTQEVTLGWAF